MTNETSDTTSSTTTTTPCCESPAQQEQQIAQQAQPETAEAFAKQFIEGPLAKSVEERLSTFDKEIGDLQIDVKCSNDEQKPAVNGVDEAQATNHHEQPKAESSPKQEEEEQVPKPTVEVIITGPTEEPATQEQAPESLPVVGASAPTETPSQQQQQPEEEFKDAVDDRPSSTTPSLIEMHPKTTPTVVDALSPDQEEVFEVKHAKHDEMKPNEEEQKEEMKKEEQKEEEKKTTIDSPVISDSPPIITSAPKPEIQQEVPEPGLKCMTVNGDEPPAAKPEIQQEVPEPGLKSMTVNGHESPAAKQEDDKPDSECMKMNGEDKRQETEQEKTEEEQLKEFKNELKKKGIKEETWRVTLEKNKKELDQPPVDKFRTIKQNIKKGNTRLLKARFEQLSKLSE